MRKAFRSDAYYERIVKEQLAKERPPPKRRRRIIVTRPKKAKLATSTPRKRKKVDAFVQELLSRQTLAERRFWKRVRGDALGVRVLRQIRFCSRYIVDFWIPEWNLVIELDGSSHHGRELYDLKRQSRIEDTYGVSFLRFTNRLVFDDLNRVIATIEQFGERYVQDHIDICTGRSLSETTN